MGGFIQWVAGTGCWEAAEGVKYPATGGNGPLGGPQEDENIQRLAEIARRKGTVSASKPPHALQCGNVLSKKKEMPRRGIPWRVGRL